ncbi:MAG TPA: endonuclease/exonuclease/phosphatase family protein [Balneolaceae bacterium]|nr:endonuclease/exonuclease/phosphatase family protein [Balneolaceae bacterium]
MKIIYTLLFTLLPAIQLETDQAIGEEMVTDSSSTFMVMSYNIRYDNTDDGINSWSNRKAHVAGMMANIYEADIIGVQEALKGQLDDLQSQMPDYSWVGAGRDDGNDKGEFSPIFYKTDRLDLVATNTFWLSETPHRPGSKSWDAAITRIATWARFKDLRTNEEFYFLNTHFDHIGEVARVESAKMIVEFVNDLDDNMPVVVTGDFNVPETSEAYSAIIGSPRLSDARYESDSGHEGPTASFSDWETLRPPESRIDYIFVSDRVDVLNHMIADDRYDGRFPSDHLPVLADIQLE